jgi:hypothetical protein
MISFPHLEKHGRLGNQLFQIASLVGMANTLKTDLAMPSWAFAKYFTHRNPWESMAAVDNLKAGGGVVIPIQEVSFHYDMLPFSLLHIDGKTCIECKGYFQTEKYFEHIKPKIKQMFTFSPLLREDVRKRNAEALERETIAIHVRRGDYVGNKSYYQLPILYFITALFENFPDWRDYNIVVFSDDINYCKTHFGCLHNVYFANGNEIEDMCLASMCDNFILSNSSFSWWMAWLGEKKNSKIIHPAHHFAGNLAKFDTKDYWPQRWTCHEHEGKKIDLSDVTFTIPVAYDHPDRKQNLELCVCMLQTYFETTIIIGEQGADKFNYMKQYCVYMFFGYMRYFHRTRMLNDMARYAKTEFVANWDADVIVPPLQLWKAVDLLRMGADMVYPYNGQFARMQRKPFFQYIEKQMDVGAVAGLTFPGMKPDDAVSVGGAVMFNRESFFNGGAENENFVSFGPEDAERFHRFKALGYNVNRTAGPLYHINHYVGPNSANKHPHVNSNRAEWEKILSMSIKELRAYVKDWKWAH